MRPFQRPVPFQVVHGCLNFNDSICNLHTFLNTSLRKLVPWSAKTVSGISCSQIIFVTNSLAPIVASWLGNGIALLNVVRSFLFPNVVMLSGPISNAHFRTVYSISVNINNIFSFSPWFVFLTEFAFCYVIFYVFC